MKKVLFATTALIATAGIASAEVSVSGWAEMGIQKSSVDNAATATIDETKTRFFQDFNVKFSMSGTTDGGMTFGANVELRDTNGYSGPGDDNGTDIYIKSAYGNLTLGNTDGAMDWAMEEVGIAASIADNNTGHAGYNGDYGDGEYNGQILRYDNTFGGFGIAISTELQNGSAANLPGYVAPVPTANPPAPAVAGNGKNGFAIGGKYAIDMGGTKVNLGVGYQTFVQGAAGATWRTGWMAGDNITITGISASANFNGIIAKAEYSMFNNTTTANTNVKHTGIGLGYKMDALTIGANWGRYQTDATGAGANFDTNGYGLAVDYDLGGGAILQAGYGNSSVGTGNNGANPPVANARTNTNNMSIGLRLNF